MQVVIPEMGSGYMSASLDQRPGTGDPLYVLNNLKSYDYHPNHCLLIEQRTRHFSLAALNKPGTSRKPRYVEDGDTPCATREGLDANHPTLD